MGEEKVGEEVITEIEDLREENRKLKEQLKLHRTKIAGIKLAFMAVSLGLLSSLSSKPSFYEVVGWLAFGFASMILGYYPSWKQSRKK